MKKKILTAILLFTVAFTICGCYARVKDRNELIKYANETYGEAKFLGSEKKLKGKESFTTILIILVDLRRLELPTSSLRTMRSPR